MMNTLLLSSTLAAQRVAALSLMLLLISGCTANGKPRYFADDTFQFETLRAIAHAPYGGSEIGEINTITAQIEDENLNDWYKQWYSMADRLERDAEKLSDKFGKGQLLLRSQNYFRTSEFFLAGDDPRRQDTFGRAKRNYQQAMTLMGVDYQYIKVPYEGKQLDAIYYPPSNPQDKNKPLVLGFGGFDSTLEEVYFYIAAPAIARGYPVVIFAGPGQGEVLREQKIQFTHEWEKPTSAVIDTIYEELYRPEKIVLIGISLGGMLAPRAAAFDKRIDGVVAWDSIFDFQNTIYATMPEFVRNKIRSDYEEGDTSLLSWLVSVKRHFDVKTEWGLNNAKWAMGVENPGDMLAAFEPYNLRDVADKISNDVLLLWGDGDHFIEDSDLDQMHAALTNARSLTTIRYDASNGGQEHIQIGILTTVHADIFSWIQDTF